MAGGPPITLRTGTVYDFYDLLMRMEFVLAGQGRELFFQEDFFISHGRQAMKSFCESTWQNMITEWKYHKYLIIRS